MMGAAWSGHPSCAIQPENKHATPETADPRLSVAIENTSQLKQGTATGVTLSRCHKPPTLDLHEDEQ